MSVDYNNTGENVDWAALWEEQCGKLGESVMGDHEKRAYQSGHPPSTNCIVTPECLREAVMMGEVPQADTPMAKATRHLEETYGPQENLNVRASFNSQGHTAELVTHRPDVGLKIN